MRPAVEGAAELRVPQRFVIASTRRRSAIAPAEWTRSPGAESTTVNPVVPPTGALVCGAPVVVFEPVPTWVTKKPVVPVVPVVAGTGQEFTNHWPDSREHLVCSTDSCFMQPLN